MKDDRRRLSKMEAYLQNHGVIRNITVQSNMPGLRYSYELERGTERICRGTPEALLFIEALYFGFQAGRASK